MIEPLLFRELAVALGLIVLLAVFVQAVFAEDGAAELVGGAGVVLARQVFVAAAFEVFDERPVGLVAVLAFGVILYGSRGATFSHFGPPVGVGTRPGPSGYGLGQA